MENLNEYDGHWITTFLGVKFHYLNPGDDEIFIKDIAHALALTCRFGGQCKYFYSVAEHSVRVSGIVEDKFKFRALLHDAHEAYLHDVPRPIKQDMPQYKIIADNIQKAILRRFACNYGEEDQADKQIKLADDILLSTEKEFMMTATGDWTPLPTPLGTFKPLSWKKAEQLFLSKFYIYSTLEL